MGLVTQEPMSAASSSVTADTYISSATASTNFGNLPNLNVGPNTSGSSALLQMDLSGLPTNLDQGQILKATLTIFANKVVIGGGVDISQVSSPWAEGSVTFAGRPSAYPPFAINVPVTTNQQYVTVDVTELVKSWVHGSTPNYGIQVTAALNNPTTTILLDSKENTSTSHPAYLDVLVGSVGSTGPMGPAGLTGPAGPAGPTGTSSSGLSSPKSCPFTGVVDRATLFGSIPQTVTIVPTITGDFVFTSIVLQEATQFIGTGGRALTVCMGRPGTCEAVYSFSLMQSSAPQNFWTEFPVSPLVGKTNSYSEALTFTPDGGNMNLLTQGSLNWAICGVYTGI
jgi:hypothetical protein